MNAAVTNQLQSMAHVMFGGLTHQPAVELAKKLVDLTAEPLQTVFFTDSGSVSVEVALKMAFQYWIAVGLPQKRRLLTVKKGYHGDTFATMAVCDPINGMHSMFKGLLMDHLFAQEPMCADNDLWDAEQLNSFKKLISEHHNELAAVILEPIVQGAGGMRFYCPDVLRQIRKLCDEFNVLLIFDEIATGFGRTGSLFAYEQAGVVPDILCLGKALTGGYMTLAATITNATVAEGISDQGRGILMHGPTFMANPLACSVALESINLLMEMPWQSRVKNIENQLKTELMNCKDIPGVADVRVKGAIGVIELHEPIDIRWMQPRFVELGVWIRPFSNLIYTMPPYIIQQTELTKITSAMNIVTKDNAKKA